MVDESFDLLGVSVHYLATQFLQEVEDDDRITVSARDAVIYDLEDTRSTTPGLIRRRGKNVLCPITNKMGAAYVHCLSRVDDVGPSTHMLSYTWGYRVGDIVDTLQTYCKYKELDPRRTYFWICCLCNNQHRVHEALASDTPVSTETFLDVFKAKVLKIGNMVSMLDLWDNPFYLKRAWCVFEIYTAVQHKVHVDIELPPRQKKKMIDDVFDMETELTGSLKQLYNTMANNKVEHAQASVKHDLETILKVLRDGLGYKRTNNLVNEIYRDWIKRTIDEHVKQIRGKWTPQASQKEDFAVFCVRAGVFYNKYGEYSFVRELSEEALDYYKNGNEDNRTCANLYNNMGIARFWEGKYGKAMDLFQKALTICKSVLGDHPDTANAHNGVALIFLTRMKTKSAINELNESLAIQYVSVGKHHPSTAWTHFLMATAYMQLPKLDEALEIFEKAIEISESAWGKTHPTTALIYANTSACLGLMGRLEDSERLLKEAKQIRQATLGLTHQDTMMCKAVIPLAVGSKYACKAFEGVTGVMMNDLPTKVFGPDSAATRLMAKAREEVGTAEALSRKTQKAVFIARKMFDAV